MDIIIRNTATGYRPLLPDIEKSIQWPPVGIFPESSTATGYDHSSSNIQSTTLRGSEKVDVRGQGTTKAVSGGSTRKSKPGFPKAADMRRPPLPFSLLEAEQERLDFSVSNGRVARVVKASK